MDTGNVNMKWGGNDIRSVPSSNTFQNYLFINNLLASNTNKCSHPTFDSLDNYRIEPSSSDVIYFEIPMDSNDFSQHAEEYFCSLQRCFRCYKGGNEKDDQVSWIYPSTIARSCEFVQEFEREGEIENNFDHKFNHCASEEDVTDISFEEEEFKGLRRL